MSKPLDYIVAAAAYQHCYEGTGFDFPNSVISFAESFNKNYNCKIDEIIARSVLRSMSNLGFLSVLEDKYAGFIVSVDQNRFDNRFSQASSEQPNLFIEPSENGSRFYMAAMMNPQLWRDLASENLEGVDQEIAVNVPASDRTVTLTHNSPEFEVIENSISLVLADLQTNNAIAERAGPDRDRLISEAKASQALIAGELIAWDKFRVVVLSFFREILKKFKEESVKWGVAKVIGIVSKLLGIG